MSWENISCSSQNMLIFLYPCNTNVFGGKLESACLSICVENTSFCQSSGEGIKSHLMTALVSFVLELTLSQTSPGF